MIAVATLLVLLVAALLVTRVATVALRASGLSEEAAALPSALRVLGCRLHDGGIRGHRAPPGTSDSSPGHPTPRGTKPQQRG